MDERQTNITKGRPLTVDSHAASARSNEPAFVARPDGAPVYHGFPALSDVCVDGFTLGKITDFEAEPSDYGDAFVIAPDGSRAGLVWEFSKTLISMRCCRLKWKGGECGQSGL
jgi:hypothetical protein